MDERLEAGRHHLTIGDRALRDGFLDDSRSHFRAALLQFRGPELRLGEAHALRGVAEVELHCGNVAEAEAGARAAGACYQQVRAQLDRVDGAGLSGELRRDAEEGEAAALVLLGDLLLRTGRGHDARRALSDARQLYSALGDVPSAAGVWIALGRLGLREGRYQDARGALDRAVTLHERFGDPSGECMAWLLRAEVDRLSDALDESAGCLEQALRLAEATRQPTLQGRAQSAMGSLWVQRGDLKAALEAYDRALALLEDAGDAELEAFALLGRGAARTRAGDASALADIVVGGRLLASLEHKHGLGMAMMRLAEVALAQHMPVYALASAESARQLWQQVDPVRGVGQAMRLQVKALAALKKWPAVVTVAHARVEVVGDQQPNAAAVRDFYRERAATSLLTDIDLLTGDQLVLRSGAMIEAMLVPMLRGLSLDFASLGLVGGAMAVLGAVSRATPAPAPVRRVVVARAGPSLTQPPPEERVAPPPLETRGEYDGLYTPPAAADHDGAPVTEGAPAPGTVMVPATTADAAAGVTGPASAGGDPSEDRGEYDGLYTPPSAADVDDVEVVAQLDDAVEKSSTPAEE